MAIAEVTTQRNTTGGAAATTHTFTYPAAPTQGNLLVAALSWRGDTTVSGVPTGWTLAANSGNQVGIDGAIYYKIAGAAEPTTATFTLAASNKASGVASEWSGIAATPLDKTDFSGASSGTQGIVGPGVLSQADELVVSMYANPGTALWSAYDNGQVEIGQIASTGGGANSRNNTAMTAVIVSSTASVTYHATLAASGAWVSALATFKAAASGTTFTITAADTITTASDSVARTWSGSRSGTDTVTSLTDTAARVWSGARGVNDTLTALSDSTSRGLIVGRAAADTITTLTAAVARAAATWTRSIADTLTTLTSTAARTWSGSRTATDTLPTLTATASRGALSLTRTATDTIASLSATATRGALALVRTGSDTITALADSVARAGGSVVVSLTDTITSLTASAARTWTGARSAADTLTTLTDSVARAGVSLTAAVADTLPTLTATASRVWNGARSASDSLTPLTASASRMWSGARTVADTITSLTATAVRGPLSLARSALDALPTPSDTISRVLAMGRALVDVLTSLTDAVIATGGQVLSIGGIGPRILSAVSGVARSIASRMAPAASAESVADVTPGGQAESTTPGGRASKL